jgi:molybdopterin synthase catalytic subunit
MHITVQLFGSIREHAGTKELTQELPEGATVGSLRHALAASLAPVAELGPRLRIAVNREVAVETTALSEGDEVALLPPVSGGSGSGRASLSERPLDVGEVVRQVTGPDAGGLVTFCGAVRNASRGHEIRHLEYEAYPPMALSEMERIIDEAEERWKGARIALAHRTGQLEIGDLAVIVAAAAPHRAEAFEAARWAIDTLKERVPIWKKEIATDGAYWVDDHA